MSGKRIVALSFCFLLLLAAVVLLPQSSEAKTHLILATGTEGGTYYPVGVAFAGLINAKLSSSSEGILMDAITSAGSFENVDLLESNLSQLAILESLIGAMAWRGMGKFRWRPMRGMLSITTLWDDVAHFLVRAQKAKTGNVMDLAQFGKDGFSMGKKGSGTRFSTDLILKNLQIYPEKVFTVVGHGYEDSFRALQKGRISGMSAPGGLPVNAVTEAFSKIGAKNLCILGFTKKQAEWVNFPLRGWHPYVIPANTYPGQTRPVASIGQPNFLAVRQNIYDDAVYLLTKTIYENLPSLKKAHKAIKAMHLKKALQSLPVPLHPGALRYYKEQGLKIPDHLFPEY